MVLQLVARVGERAIRTVLPARDEDLVARRDEPQQVVRVAEALETPAHVHLDDQVGAMRCERGACAAQRVELISLDVDEQYLRRPGPGPKRARPNASRARPRRVHRRGGSVRRSTV
jgi:hypothetical protein